MFVIATKCKLKYVRVAAIIGLFLTSCSNQPPPLPKEQGVAHGEPLKVQEVNAWQLPSIFQKGNTIRFLANGAKTSDREISSAAFAYKILEVHGKWIHLEQDMSGGSMEMLLIWKRDIKEHLEQPESEKHKYSSESSCKYCQSTPWWISDVGWWNTDYMLNVILLNSSAAIGDQK